MKPGEARAYAKSMLGGLVTVSAQRNHLQQVLLVEMEMKQEMYLSITLDPEIESRTAHGVQSRGGTSIEDVAASNPEFIFTQPIDIADGFDGRRMRAHGESTSVWKKEPLHEARLLLMKNVCNMFYRHRLHPARNSSGGNSGRVTLSFATPRSTLTITPNFVKAVSLPDADSGRSP
jgi:succinyl-CoA synthetase beta subunit